MMETSQNRLPNGPGRAKICKVCGKEGQSMGIRDHIEANHLEGDSLPCNVCGQKVLCNKLSHRVVRQLIAQNPSRCKLLQIFCAITPYCTERFCAIKPCFFFQAITEQQWLLSQSDDQYKTESLKEGLITLSTKVGKYISS